MKTMSKFFRSSKVNKSQNEADEKFQNENAYRVEHSASDPTLLPPVPNNSNKHNLDYFEKITVPPSTELIPDEYIHEDNTQGLVLIFHSDNDKQGGILLKEAFLEYDYNVTVYRMSTKHFVMNSLRKVAESDHSDKTCLIAIFLGNMYEEADYYIFPDDNRIDYGGYCEVVKNTLSLKDIWTPFTSDKCPSFKYKPKIFIFQSYQKPKLPVLKDIYPIRLGAISEEDIEVYEKPPKNAYDVPAEADLLIIHKPIIGSKNRNIFIRQLCKHLHLEGHTDDIIDLITHTEHSQRRPLIISTMTRKFYIKSSDRLGHRGHHHELHIVQNMIETRLQALYNRVMTMQEVDKFQKPSKPTRKWNFW